MISKTTRAHLAVLGTNLFFAGNFSLVKMISPGLIQPFGLNLLRVGFSVVLFWLVWMFGRSGAGFRREDTGRFLLCALAGVAINQMLFVKGLTMTTTIHASLLMLVTPLLVTLFALWVLKEGFTIFKAAGLALGIGGAVFLVMQKEGGHQASDYLSGDLLVLVNSISYSVYFILVKPLMARYGPLHVVRWAFTLGFLIVLPFGWQDVATASWQAFRWQELLALFMIVFTGTFLAYYFNAYGIQYIGASATGTYIYTQPVFAVAIAIIFLNEAFSWQKAVAALLIFTGVYLVSRKGKRSTSPV